MKKFGMMHLQMRKTKHRRLQTPSAVHLSVAITRVLEFISVMVFLPHWRKLTGDPYMELQITSVQDLHSFLMD